MQSFHVETTVAAPLETVWRYLTEPALIRDWFGWDHPELEDEIRYIFVDHAELTPPDRIGMGDQELRLLAVEGGTVVQATRAGEPSERDAYDAIEEGWRTFFEQLRFLLARAATQRRTVFLSGSAVPAHLAAALDGGEPWHTSRHQQITVDAAGHLVALLTQRPLAAQTPAEATLTLSTFGLDGDAFAAVEREWQRRWNAVTT